MKRTRRERVRRAAKWAGTAACLTVCVAWIATHRWMYGYVWRDDAYEDGGMVVLIAGTLSCATGSTDNLLIGLRDGWGLYPNRTNRLWLWLPRYARHQSGPVELQIPLWMIFGVAAVPTAWLWYRDRRRARPGHCVCGYSLAGLAEGAPCPECGKVPP